MIKLNHLFLILTLHIFYDEAIGKALFPQLSITLPTRQSFRNKNFSQAFDKDPKSTPLIFFYGKECTHSKVMHPLIAKLEAELGITIHKLEVWHNIENYKVLQLFDRHSRCGGLPFFYNLKTHKAICGATDYTNLKNWASDSNCRFHSPPSVNQPEINLLYKKTGLTARFLRVLENLGREKMRQRLLNETNIQ